MSVPDVSPFLTPPPSTTADTLAVLHLRRDNLVPIVLRDSDVEGSGYAEGCVATTRFGSFPHSTLLGQPWGSQILASQVDTGSRGRQPTFKGQKRKRAAKDQPGEDLNAPDNASDSQSARPPPQKTAVRAASGFCHVVLPTPETWTQSLPHRTQVVYTPDYSHIIQKLRIRPGSRVIEAGAGSGSFTHAAIRAAFNGYPPPSNASTDAEAPDHLSAGHVFSFEYHEPRVDTLAAELKTHGLRSVVTLTHRDVYRDGFALPDRRVHAQHVFLDLPAPWTALPHLTRTASPSALDPLRPVHLCAFLPCIEQVQRMAGALRQHGWVEVRVHELAHRRLDVRRERVGLRYEGQRGVTASAASVRESLDRLRVVEARARLRRAGSTASITAPDTDLAAADDPPAPPRLESKAARLARIARESHDQKPWRAGRLVCRTEPELKTHTSYLVFAVLPRPWSAEDEARAARKWSGNAQKIGRANDARGSR